MLCFSVSSDVTFHYQTQPPERGLKGISFSVLPGTTTGMTRKNVLCVQGTDDLLGVVPVAIVGHSGSGKTTLSRLLFRFYDPVRGRVKLGGYDIKHYTQARYILRNPRPIPHNTIPTCLFVNTCCVFCSVRGCVGIVPQDTVLFNDTILHNVRYGNMKASMRDIEAAAEAAQIKSFIESLPDKWDTQVLDPCHAFYAYVQLVEDRNGRRQCEQQHTTIRPITGCCFWILAESMTAVADCVD